MIFLLSGSLRLGHAGIGEGDEKDGNDMRIHEHDHFFFMSKQTVSTDYVCMTVNDNDKFELCTLLCNVRNY